VIIGTESISNAPIKRAHDRSLSREAAANLFYISILVANFEATQLKVKSSNRPLVDHFAHARQDYSRLSLSGAVGEYPSAEILHYYRIVESGSSGLRGERLMTKSPR